MVSEVWLLWQKCKLYLLADCSGRSFFELFPSTLQFCPDLSQTTKAWSRDYWLRRKPTWAARTRAVIRAGTQWWREPTASRKTWRCISASETVVPDECSGNHLQTSIRQIGVNIIILTGNPSKSYGASPAIWDHTVSPATRHKWTLPALTQAGKLVLDLPNPEGWKLELT